MAPKKSGLAAAIIMLGIIAIMAYFFATGINNSPFATTDTPTVLASH